MVNFDLTIDKISGYIKQARSQELLDIIKEIYQLDHNIGYLQEGSEELQTYGKEYLGFISNSIKNSKIDTADMTILDIGCGGGIVLNQLYKEYTSSKVIGIEPSPLAKRASEKFGFKLIEEFYPPQNREDIKELDVVLHYDVLEHVENPLKFLEEIYKDLKVDALMVFSVPDCTTAIKNGDISILIHEHLNYFSVDSLKKLVEQAGYSDVVVEQGIHGGTLLCSARKRDIKNSVVIDTKTIEDDFRKFIEKNRALIEKLKNIIASYSDKSIGFYVPLRAIPYITKLELTRGYSFYDDSKFFSHKYLDGFDDVKIQNFYDLQKEPVDVIFIMTHAYGSIIKHRIEKENIDTKIVLLQNLFKQKEKN